MVVHRPINKKRRASKAAVTQLTYTERRASYRYINSQARSKPTHCLQLTLRRIQRQSTRILEARASHKRYQQLHRPRDISSLPPSHQRP